MLEEIIKDKCLKTLVIIDEKSQLCKTTKPRKTSKTRKTRKTR